MSIAAAAHLLAAAPPAPTSRNGTPLAMGARIVAMAAYLSGAVAWLFAAHIPAAARRGLPAQALDPLLRVGVLVAAHVPLAHAVPLRAPARFPSRLAGIPAMLGLAIGFGLTALAGVLPSGLPRAAALRRIDRRGTPTPR